MGDVAGAISQLELVVKANPNDAAARLALGVALSSSRRYDDAAAQFRKAGELMPTSVVPRLLTEGALREKQNGALRKGISARPEASLGETRAGTRAAAIVPIQAVNGSLELLAEAVRRYPQNAIFRSLLGDVYQMIGRYPEAAAQYREATELAPKWVKPRFNLGMANLQIEPAQAAEDFKAVLRMDPSNTLARLYLGDAYAYQNHYTEARREYQVAEADKDLAPLARTRLGNLLLKENQPVQAEREFEQAAKAAPSAPEVRAGIGEALVRQKKFEQGARELEKAAELSAQQVPPAAQAALRSRAADAYVQGGQIAKAEKVLISNLDLPHADPFPRMVELSDRSGKLDEEIAAKEKVLLSRPRDVQALRFLLAAHRYRKNHVEAVEVLQRLLGAAPAGSGQWYRELGEEYQALGKKQEAVEAWKKGLEVGSPEDANRIIGAAESAGALPEIEKHYRDRFDGNQSDPDAGQILAGIYEQSGRLREALTVREKLVRLLPESQSNWMTLALAYERLGLKDKAALAYDRAAVLGDSVGLQSLARQKAKALRQGK